jgi:septal ring factor EnvC (AmiA/AmiB activator)
LLPWDNELSLLNHFTFKKAPQLMCFLCLLFASSLMLGTSWAQQTEDLKSIQQQIKEKQQQVAEQLKRAHKLQQELEYAEVSVAKTVKALTITERALADNKSQRTQLGKQQKEVQQQIALEQDGLAKLIKSAYMTGNYDFAKMLLNQQDAANFERTITYYQYLNNERRHKIDEFRVLIVELEQVNAQLATKQQELAQLQSEQKAQKAQLTKQQASRESTLANIRSAIESEAAKIEILQQNEKNLQDALVRAERESEKQNQTFSGLNGVKGKLLIPANGELLKMFGRIRQGQIKWKGIIIKGQVGSPVIAVHQGKVLYADWLRGFGLVTVIDHGEGFMSLYGHNQALLKQAGDIVTAGETIALLGQSGGQTNPNLYFEIRHKGQPVNPTSWLNL